MLQEVKTASGKFVVHRGGNTDKKQSIIATCDAILILLYKKLYKNSAHVNGP